MNERDVPVVGVTVHTALCVFASGADSLTWNSSPATFKQLGQLTSVVLPIKCGVIGLCVCV